MSSQHNREGATRTEPLEGWKLWQGTTQPREIFHELTFTTSHFLLKITTKFNILRSHPPSVWDCCWKRWSRSCHARDVNIRGMEWETGFRSGGGSRSWTPGCWAPVSWEHCPAHILLSDSLLLSLCSLLSDASNKNFSLTVKLVWSVKTHWKEMTRCPKNSLFKCSLQLQSSFPEFLMPPLLLRQMLSCKIHRPQKNYRDINSW